ncbi:MAG: SAM-dependent DNA methyltransferase [Holdemanella sp.]|nr:SAM-dependent DNA methyltransferase [Holdemanella sp.]
MITGELKSKIDSIWDTIWTGGISSPITVLEQITYLMFMKLLDDTETRKEGAASIFKGMKYKSKVFKEGNFFPDKDRNREIPYADLRWSSFKHKSPEQMFDLVKDYVFPFIKKVNGESKETAFSRFMEDAVFLIPTPKVLGVCVDTLSDIDMANKDIMGDVYEYCLGKMASSGTLGQFRTPRHIIDMIVNITSPTLDDTILDPAMGSAGFLLGTAQYIHDHYEIELHNKEKQKHFSSTMFNGFDTDPSMLRIGAMNMLLHGIDEPNIARQDSLSDENGVRNAYSLIMANPPFAGSVFPEDISKDLLSICKTKKTELLFLALFIKSLKLGGRCACIVPDGVLFGSSRAHKDIRKELIENNKLQAVISMPSGVFKPYAGVSTAILVFTKDPSGTKDVWFYDMKADGYSLDDKRSEIAENDIPDIISRYHNLDGEKDRKRTEQSFFVSKKEIVDNGYDLSINKYKEVVYKKVEYRSTKEIFAEIDELNKQASQLEDELRKLLGIN